MNVSAVLVTKGDQYDMHPAYAAGFIDGEGCVIARLCPRRINGFQVSPTFFVAIEVTNTYREALVALQRSYGGRLYSKCHAPQQMAKLEAWVLRFMGNDCEKLARAILPYSIVKRSQLELLIEARELLTPHGGGPRITDANHTRRQEIVARMAAEKKEGTVLRAVV